MLIRSEWLLRHNQSLMYLHGLPATLQEQTMFWINMKDIDRHPEVIPLIAKLYEASSFCVLSRGVTAPTTNSTISATAALAPPLMLSTPSLFGLTSVAAVPVAAPVIPVAPVPAAPPTAAPGNQPLLFAPGLRTEDFTMLTNTIAEKLGTLLATNQTTPARDHPTQT